MCCTLCKSKTKTLVLTASQKKLHREGVLTLTLLLQVTSGCKGLCVCVGGRGMGKVCPFQIRSLESGWRPSSPFWGGKTMSYCANRWL